MTPLESDNRVGVFARIVAWWQGLIETVSPDLARCEYGCRVSACNSERFDTCDKRLDHASEVRESEAKAILGAAGQAATVADQR